MRQRNINLDELMSRLLIGRFHWDRYHGGGGTELGERDRERERPHFSRLTGALATTGYGLKRGRLSTSERRRRGLASDDWSVNYISEAAAAA